MDDKHQAHRDSIKTAQQLIYDGAFQDALTQLTAVLKDAPKLVDALYMKAVCERYLADFDSASDTLRHLHAIEPEFGRAYQEQGHLYKAKGDAPRALNAYRRASAANPALIAAWRAQSEILRSMNKAAEAGQAAAQADRLSVLPKALLAAINHVHEGKLRKAEQFCRAFLQKNPTHVEAMRLLADIASRFGVTHEAEFLLESALEFEPENVQARLDYIKTLRQRRKYQEAVAEAEKLYNKDKANPVFKSHYAVESLHIGEFDRAISLFDEILEKLPGDPGTLSSRGHALKTCGRTDEAIQSYQRAYGAKPDHGDAFYSLANLKTYTFNDAEIEAMRAQLSRDDIAYKDRFQLCFALAKALEDREIYDEAFAYYGQGNTLKRTQSRYNADDMTEEMRAQAEHCTSRLFQSRAGVGHDAPDPIFIVGLPRAGSTLLEQILASHSQVDGTLELPNILALAQSLRGRSGAGEKSAYPECLHTLPSDKFEEMGRKYIDETRVHRQGAPFFIDKMPNNFRHIGLIRLILPNAKIIDARREPMACCFSGFKQLFAEGQEFTYGLEQIGRYYRDYVDLMRHWDEVLPGEVLRVQHEDVLEDLEAQVRRMLDFCGLPFEDACLEFHKTERSVRTASSEQVRKPINTSGVDQWRPFEPYLDPLKAALGPTLTEYRT